jgi:hypothetical protein
MTKIVINFVQFVKFLSKKVSMKKIWREKYIFTEKNTIYYICFCYNMESAYKTLEASPSESFDSIREKFIRKIIKIHPDKDELKSEEAKTLTEAWAYVKENHSNGINKTEQVAAVVSEENQDSEMKQFLKQIYNEGKVEKLEDKEETGWFTTLYDYLWGDDIDEEEESQEVTEEVTEVDESKLYNEVDQEDTSNNEKIEKTLRE